MDQDAEFDCRPVYQAETSWSLGRHPSVSVNPKLDISVDNPKSRSSLPLQRKLGLNANSMYRLNACWRN